MNTDINTSVSNDAKLIIECFGQETAIPYSHLFFPKLYIPLFLLKVWKFNLRWYGDINTSVSVVAKPIIELFLTRNGNTLFLHVYFLDCKYLCIS